jgi:sugar lactone lactonase YvrE
VADSTNQTIRKVTPVGVVTTLAGLAGSYGSADGTGSAARFAQPQGVAVDSAGNVYVTDTDNSTIRKVTPTGTVTTLAGVAAHPGSADGTGSAAMFFEPSGVAVDNAGNVYVADTLNSTIRKVTPAGVVTTLAGLALFDPKVGVVVGFADGRGSAARFSQPRGLAVDGAGNVYVADTGNFTIRKVTPAGVVTTLRGSGAQFGGDLAGGPSSVAVDSAGNVYAADPPSNTIRKVTPAGVVTTLAGLADPKVYRHSVGGSADGTGSAVQFRHPYGVAVDSAGNVYVADTGNNTIRKGYSAPRILNSGPGFGFNGGQFGFTLMGPTGRLVIVETSTDLVNWLPMWTNNFSVALNFSDPQSGLYSNRFYRAHSP